MKTRNEFNFDALTPPFASTPSKRTPFSAISLIVVYIAGLDSRVTSFPDDRVGEHVHAIDRHNDECIVMIERYVGGANGSPTHRVPSDCDGIVCRNALGSCSAEAYSGVAWQPRDARVEKLGRGLRHLEIKVAVVYYAWARERVRPLKGRCVEL